MSLKSELDAAVKTAKGSHATHHKRGERVRDFCEYLHRHDIRPPNVKRLGRRAVVAYARDLAGRVSKRTAQTYLAELRQTLRKAGRPDLADCFRNRDLGITGASRAGAKTAIPRAEFDARAARLRDDGVRAAAELCYALGLRRQEAVMSWKSLDDWARALAEGRPLRVVHGAKGGRPRHVSPPDVPAARAAVERAREVAQGHYLVRGKSPGLRSALDKFSSAAKRAGFTGVYAPHSARYAFTRARVAAYEASGDSRDNASAAAATDLGHGDQRGRWVEHVYLR